MYVQSNALYTPAAGSTKTDVLQRFLAVNQIYMISEHLSKRTIHFHVVLFLEGPRHGYRVDKVASIYLVLVPLSVALLTWALRLEPQP